MAPFNVTALGALPYFLIFLVIGLAFGAVLESSGFGDSRKLAAQFYFKEMTVLKVMFTAIVVACILIFLSTSLGLLDFDKIWVNPTYLYSEIAGGLIMGVGFIIGGFCPGTSLVAAATGKVDGIVFVLGVVFGVYVFGESVHSFEGFFNGSYMGRFTLPDLFGIPAGWTILALVLMALAMFYGAEIAEEIFGRDKFSREVKLLPQNYRKIAAAAVLVALTVVLIVHGQPSAEGKWNLIAATQAPRLARRDVYVHPAEVVQLKKDPSLYVRILDVRGESEYNLFHLAGAERLAPEAITAPVVVREMLSAPENTVYFLVSDDEAAATTAWKLLRGAGILNLYIIDGGINHWLELYPPDPCVARRAENKGADAEHLKYAFRYAVGDRIDQAHPYLIRRESFSACSGTALSASAAEETKPAAYDFIRKVKLQRKTAVKGGCG